MAVFNTCAYPSHSARRVFIKPGSVKMRLKEGRVVGGKSKLQVRSGNHYRFELETRGRGQHLRAE